MASVPWYKGEGMDYEEFSPLTSGPGKRARTPFPYRDAWQNTTNHPEPTSTHTSPGEGVIHA